MVRDGGRMDDHCCRDECCGPGSWCCAHAGPHEHPELDEAPPEPYPTEPAKLLPRFELTPAQRRQIERLRRRARPVSPRG